MTGATVITQVEELLRQRFAPTVLEVEDESYLHRGHAEAGAGKHLRVTIVSEQLASCSRIEAHRAVYEALGDLIPSAVHAVSLKVLR